MTGDIALIICSLITAVSATVVAVISRQADIDRKRTEARAARRERESRLSMEMMSANCELAAVTACALRDGHTNGTLEPALAKAEKARQDYQSFLMDTAARDVAKV